MRTFIQWLAERAPFDPENDDPVDHPNYKPDVFDVPVDPEHFISFGTLPPEHPGQPKPKPKPKPEPSPPQSQDGPQQPWPYDPSKPYATIPAPPAMVKPAMVKPAMVKPAMVDTPLPEVPELPKPVLPNPLPRVDSPAKRSEATRVMSKFRTAFLEKFGVPVRVGKEIIKRYGHPKHRAVDLYQYLANEPSIDVEEEVRVAKAQIAYNKAEDDNYNRHLTSRMGGFSMRR